MKIGLLLYIDILILVFMAAAMTHYHIKSKKLVHITSYYTFSLVVLALVTFLDAIFAGHFSILKNNMVCMPLIILYLILQALLPYCFFLISIVAVRKMSLLKNAAFTITTLIPVIIYSVLVLMSPILGIMLEIKQHFGAVDIIFLPVFFIVFLAVYMFYIGGIIYFCHSNRSTLAGEYHVILISYIIFFPVILLVNTISRINIPYHMVSAIFLCLFYLTMYNRSIYHSSQGLNDYNRSQFINLVDNYLYSDKHFIIIAVVINEFDKLTEKYNDKNINVLLGNIKEFFSKIFPLNDIFHYDNLNFILVFDNTQSIRSTGPIIDEILSIFNMPWDIGNNREKMTVTISSLFCPEDSKNLTEIIDILRNSIENASKSGTNSIVYGKEHIYNREKVLNSLTYEKRQLEHMAKEAMSSRTSLETVKKNQSIFLSNISHEIYTPLNSVLGMSELLLKENLSPSAKNKAVSIKQASTSLFNTFNNLLDYFNIDSGQLEIVEAPYNINEIAHEALNVISVQAKEKGIELNFSIDSAIPSKLLGDAQRIRQVIINLLKNALRTTSHGSISLQIKQETLINDYIELHVSVADTGIGMKHDELEKIFDNLQTFDTRRSNNTEKNALSMAVCKKILDLMKGSISAESNYRVGSTFSFHLPQKIYDYVSIADANENTSYKTTQFIETFTAENASVLVVDDNRLNREVTKALLLPYKIKVTTAKSGQECLDLIQNNTYDLIFMDHLMPEMDGIDTKNRIRQMEGDYFATVPIVILTANVGNGNKKQFMEQGFAEYIPKPIDVALLDSVLKQFLPKKYIEEKTSDTDSDKPFGGELPVIEGMDTAVALSNFETMDDLLVELQKFSQNGPDILIELEHSLIHNNISLYLMYLTNLTAFAGKFGMQKLVRLCNAHEKAAQQDNIDFLKNNLPFLIQAYKRFLDSLR